MPTKPSSHCQAELERRQAGLGGDRHRHLVADLEAAGAGELLLGQEQRRHVAQRLQVFGAARGAGREAGQRQLPERLRDRRAARACAARAPALPPAGHVAARCRRVRRLRARSARSRARSSAAPRRAAAGAVEVPVAQDDGAPSPARARGCAGAWVWPWTSVGAPARRSSQPRAASASTSMNIAARPRRALRRCCCAHRRPIARRAATAAGRANGALHAGPPNDRAVALVGDVAEAERVAVRDQHPLRRRRRAASGRARRMTPQSLEHRVADQEVAVAGHEGDGPVPRPRLAQDLGAARLEAALGRCRRRSRPRTGRRG